MKFTITRETFYSYDPFIGETEAKTEKLNIPYESGTTIWYIMKKKKTFVVIELVVNGCYSDGIDYGIIARTPRLENFERERFDISYNEFSNIYLSKTDAIDECLKKINRKKVKVY